jgi:hypothetical protein
MKIVLFLSIILISVSCGVKVPYTDEVKNEYSLDENSLKKVQFFTSATIILQRKNSLENQGTTTSGALVTNENSVENRIIIPVNTKCVFEKMEANGDLHVRFETGQNKTLRYAVRKGQNSGRYYLVATWDQKKGGQLDYGNLTYYATPESGNAYLLVVTKKLKKVRRKDRVVKGMKV